MGLLTDDMKGGQAIVLVRVERALPLISPVYDSGAGEEEIKSQREQYWATIR